jgi:putative ABC transport system substrate-binding protein
MRCAINLVMQQSDRFRGEKRTSHAQSKSVATDSSRTLADIICCDALLGSLLVYGPQLWEQAMRRRDFIVAAGVAAAWPLAALAQQPAIPVIGYLASGSASSFVAESEAFRRGLEETNYIENRNVAIEYRWAAGHYDQLPMLAEDFVRRHVAIIAALGSSAPGQAAKAATSTIPIVFQTGGDPVQEGLVASMNRPGGNITGVSRMNVATDPKRLELLHEAVPTATAISYLINPASPRSGSQVQQIEDSARVLGLKLQIVKASAASDLGAAFAEMAQVGARALLVVGDPSITPMINQIAEIAIRNGMPTMAATRANVSAGCLMSYDASLPDSWRQAGVYVGRILKGEKPADLPIMQPTKFELIINLKTAKALGMTIPPTLLARADEVTE